METKLPLTTKDMNTSSLPRPTPTRLPVPGSKIKAPAIKRSRSPEDKSLNQTVGVKRSRIEPVATSTPRGQGSFKAPARPAKVSAARQAAQSNNRRAGSTTRSTGVLSRSSSTSSLNSTRPATRSNSGSSLNATTHVGPAGGANTTTAAPKQGKSRRPAWDLKGRLQDMEQQLSKRDAVSLTLQGQLDNNNARIALLESQNQLLSGTVAQKEQQTSAISEEIRTVERRLRDKEDELDSVRRRFEREQDDLRRNHERAVDDLKFKTSTLERQKESLEAELRASQQENSGLKSTVAQLMSSQAELAATKVNLEQSYRAGRLKDEEIASLKQTIADQIAQLDEGQQKMREHETMRRKLHNTIQELKGNIRVFCRVRPLLGDERLPNDGVIQHMHFTDTDEKVIELDKLADVNPNESLATSLRRGTNKYEFSYDRVFPPACGQSQVFEEISQLVQSALDGYNVCIFAYGQTGSGKTYTMEGPDDVTEETMGMIPRAVEQIFCSARDLTEKGWQYKFTASFLEIYNETIRDLLGSGKSEYKHEIRMVAGSNEVMVADLTLVPVTSETQVAGLLKKAGENRAVAETKCNERSSRSHSVFQLKLMGSNELTGETCQGLLSLVDLAGSERLKDSGSEGQRLKEAQSINKSLSNLGNVIMALGNKENHVPYRNSKLTYLLQNSLGGNSKTLMFVNVSPKEECFHETLCSLRFATKVNQTNIGTAQKKVK